MDRIIEFIVKFKEILVAIATALGAIVTIYLQWHKISVVWLKIPKIKRTRIFWIAMAIILLSAQFSFFQFNYLPLKIQRVKDQNKLDSLRAESKKLEQAKDFISIAELEKKMSLSNPNIKNINKSELLDQVDSLVFIAKNAHTCFDSLKIKNSTIKDQRMLINNLDNSRDSLKKEVMNANTLLRIFKENTNIEITINTLEKYQDNKKIKQLISKLRDEGFKVEDPSYFLALEKNLCLCYCSAREKRAQYIANLSNEIFQLQRSNLMNIEIIEDQEQQHKIILVLAKLP